MSDPREQVEEVHFHSVAQKHNLVTMYSGNVLYSKKLSQGEILFGPEKQHCIKLDK